jgi:hypothetical protein
MTEGVLKGRTDTAISLHSFSRQCNQQLQMIDLQPLLDIFAKYQAARIADNNESAACFSP